jgi:heme/copper-type cytochrome/quinol oxidase subunit 3
MTVMIESAIPSVAAPAPRRAQVVPNGVLGVLIFVFTEVMFFGGLVSAYIIGEASAPFGWPPPDQPRLPWEETAFNTAALLASGFFVWRAGRTFARDRREARWPLMIALGLGAFFVMAQGVEWIDLVREGLTLTSSTHGGFFYLIVGSHAVHALAAVVVLATTLAALFRDRLDATTFAAVRIYWYFVVAVWPFLYTQVYW